MTRTLRDDTKAFDPGRLALSRAKLAALQPELLSPLRWMFASKRLIAGHKKGREYLLTHVEEHLMHGDSRAAIVVSIAPLRIAAYSGDIDCVALLHFAPGLATQHQLAVGQRMLTVNTYSARALGVGRDLHEGPAATRIWGNFAPYIAELLSDDRERIEAHKATIGEPEWARAAELARRWVGEHGMLARDGRPLQCAVEAHIRA